MTNEEAIETLREIALYVPTGVVDPSDFYLALDLAIKTLEGSKQGEWTPVSEGLPKEDNDYLVTYMSYGERLVSKSWFNTRNGFIYDNVIAWRPLPEPYQKGGVE